MSEQKLVLDLDITEEGNDFSANLIEEISKTEFELLVIEENINSISNIKPECDKIDYILATCSGAICGLIDVFLIGKPGESPVGDITDKWFADRTIDFAKLCGYKCDELSLSSALEFLEKKFKVPYDQSVGGGIFKELLNLTPDNHHFKSLSHNPSLLGLFFSILDQFTNRSHFVSGGDLVALENASSSFELRGTTVPEKIFFGFVNWFGHLISDVSGSSSSKGRGMGLPSPFWTWTNDIIAIKRELNISPNSFDKSISELAVNIFKKGFDVRFQSAQLIPVIVNEMIVRTLFSIRRFISYVGNNCLDQYEFASVWEECEPFSNPTVKRMLTVAHGTFCLLDVGDATVRGFVSGVGSFNAVEFFLRLNVTGIGRFTISIYGEATREINYLKYEREAEFKAKEKSILEWYLYELQELAKLYDDEDLLSFVDDFKESGAYKTAFQKTVELAAKQSVPNEKILKDKNDIDNYFVVKSNE